VEPPYPATHSSRGPRECAELVGIARVPLELCPPGGGLLDHLAEAAPEPRVRQYRTSRKPPISAMKPFWIEGTAPSTLGYMV
jgi:hypothetical protein